jgi:hypothetical protein
MAATAATRVAMAMNFMFEENGTVCATYGIVEEMYVDIRTRVADL